MQNILCSKPACSIADLVPTNWLDPLLTGPDKLLPDGYIYNPEDIEKLLHAIKSRIESAEAKRQKMNCGYCKDCKWRDEYGSCKNSKMIDENYDQGFGKNNDRLIYSYQVGGEFWVGANFGCIHFKKKQGQNP